VNDLVNPPIPHNVVYGSVGYTLDPNRAHAVQTASTIPGRVYQYDNNGNMKSDGLRTVTYTPDNLPNDITIGAAKTSFTYDGNGTRVKKAYGGMTRVYIDKLYDSYDGDSNNYIYAGNTRIALHWTNVPTQQDGTVYYHPDHLGSTSIVTDDYGNKVEDIFYYSFGETRQDTGSGNLMHKYTGQELDYETNLYNYGARLYDPEIGRFISPDSIVPDFTNPQSLNRYAYTVNNPMRYNDPTGHDYEDSTWYSTPDPPDWETGDNWTVEDMGGLPSGGNGGLGGGGRPGGSGPSSGGNGNVGSTSTLTFGTPSDQAYASHAQQSMQDYIADIPQRVAMGLIWGSLGPSGGEIAATEATEGILAKIAGLVRNPWGKLGGPEHKEAINLLENEFKQIGYKVQREVYSETPEGIKRGRFADLTVTNPNGNQFVIQVGRQTQSGAPISREMKALQDFRNLGMKAFFVPYN
jgi:RHS repeat-associated protein